VELILQLSYRPENKEVCLNPNWSAEITHSSDTSHAVLANGYCMSEHTIYSTFRHKCLMRMFKPVLIWDRNISLSASKCYLLHTPQTPHTLSVSVSVILLSQILKYDHESQGTRTRERLRWPGPATYTEDRPVLSSEREPQKTRPQRSKSNKYLVGLDAKNYWLTVAMWHWLWVQFSSARESVKRGPERVNLKTRHC
jgi:hypothetical protein